MADLHVLMCMSYCCLPPPVNYTSPGGLRLQSPTSFIIFTAAKAATATLALVNTPLHFFNPLDPILGQYQIQESQEKLSHSSQAPHCEYRQTAGGNKVLSHITPHSSDNKGCVASQGFNQKDGHVIFWTRLSMCLLLKHLIMM
jgi:hypothetical protein